MGRLVIVVTVLSSLGAWAQTAPEAEWEGLQQPTLVPEVAPPPPPEPARQPLPYAPGASANTPPPMPLRMPPTIARYVPVKEDPNRVSVFGALALGQWKRAQSIYFGFPFLGIRLGVGLTDRVDLFIGMDSFWGMMNEPRAAVRWNVLQGENWAFAAAVEAGWAFFNTKPAADVHGARWLSGRRNYNIAPGVLLSYQGDNHRATRLFFDFRYQASLDTEPFQRDPLGGVPASIALGNNVLFKVGVELPLSPRSAVVFGLNIDAHLRSGDSLLMPGIQVGVVTSL